MRFNWSRSLIAVVLVSSLGALSCSVEEEDQNLKDVKALVAKCSVELAAGNYLDARNAAQQVVNLPRLATVADVAVDQARFCYTTSNSLYQLNKMTSDLESLLKMALGLFGGSLNLSSPQDLQALALDYAEGRLDPQATSAISILIGGFLDPIKSTLEENRKQLEEIIKKKRFRWYVQHVPVKIAESELMDAGGVYDLGEIHLLYGLTRSILSVLYMVESQDYNVDVKALLNYVTKVDADVNPVLKIFDEPGRAVTNIIAVVMGSSPRFLMLDASIGKELMSQAGEGLSEGFAGVLNAVNAMKKRRGDQSLNVVEYKREDISGKGEEDLFIVHLKFNNSANPLPIVNLQKFTGLVIPLREDVLQSLANMRDDFAGASGVNTNLQRDIFPIIALVAVVLINSGAFDAIIDLALSGAEPEMQETADQVLSIVGENRDIVTGALVALVPVEIEFDFGAVFKNPAGLRDIFPAWVQPADNSNMTAFTEATIVYSYECDGNPDPLIEGSLLCTTPRTPLDRNGLGGNWHFQDAMDDTPERFAYYRLVTVPTTGEVKEPPELEKIVSNLYWKDYPARSNFGTKWNAEVPLDDDGIDTVIPYIGFKDPTFGGVLYLDIGNIQNENLMPDGSGVEPATLKTLNATIANIVATVQDFL